MTISPLCAAILISCDETGPRRASANPAGGAGSSGRNCPCQIVAVRTSWAETSLLGGRGRRQIEGPGVILANDGGRALVLTCRRLVDPPYDPQGPRNAREIAFGVYYPGQAGQFLHGRLVAVYMNAMDLALLRIDAVSPQRFAAPMVQPSQFRGSEPVMLYGRPCDGSFLISNGAVTSSSYDARLGGQHMCIGVTAGALDRMGVAVAGGSGRLIGLVSAQQGSREWVQCVYQAAQQEYWEYLVDEAATRELLGMIR